MENQTKEKSKVYSSLLVIGGGIAGIETAIQAANRGIKLLLIEREEQLGGILTKINSFYSLQEKPAELLAKRARQLNDHPNVRIMYNSTLTDVDGIIGDFTVYINTNGQEICEKVGAIVVATGLQSIFCPVKYSLDLTENVIGQLKLEKLLAENKDFRDKRITFVVGRTSENYQLPFIVALKNAVFLREMGCTVNVFYRNMKVAADNVEALFYKAKVLDVKFYKYENNIEIFTKNNQIIINFEDPFLKGQISANYQVISDLIVLPEELLPAEDTDELGKLLNINIGQNFMGENNVHVMSEFTSREGIYLVGSTHYPCLLPEIEIDARVIVSEIYKKLVSQEIEIDFTQPYVDAKKCVVCLTCYRCCPHGAITIVHDEIHENLYKSAAQMNPLACKRCGLCAAECPGKAIQLPAYTDNDILAQLESLEV